MRHTAKLENLCLLYRPCYFYCKLFNIIQYYTWADLNPKFQNMMLPRLAHLWGKLSGCLRQQIVGGATISNCLIASTTPSSPSTPGLENGEEDRGKYGREVSAEAEKEEVGTTLNKRAAAFGMLLQASGGNIGISIGSNIPKTCKPTSRFKLTMS